ncbi:folylpolyglutamate synthase/dihydrofolate synthase family protein [Lachnospiraceae bacterium 29-84]
MNQEEVERYFKKLQETGGIQLGLSGMRRLMGMLGDPHEKMDYIHVAGTNGKGSTCAMLSEILQRSGYCVGLYTSPAVFGRNGQYLVNGEAVEGEAFAAVVTEIEDACSKMEDLGFVHPTAFEVETAAAFVWFLRQGCQVVVLETGMGGGGDATNIIKRPLVSVITSISKDHMRFLGDNIEGIAQAKAGIIKEGGSVVAAWPKEPGVRRAIEAVCQEKHASLVYAKEEEAKKVCWEQGKLCFSYGRVGKVRLSLAGAYQVQNAACVIETVGLLREAGLRIPGEAALQGLSHTRWEGRFTVLCKEPLFVIDGAHNEGAAEKLCETLKMGFTNRKIIYIIGVLADKAHERMLEIMMPLAWKVITVTPKHPRALDGRQLAIEAGQYHKDVSYSPEIAQAVGQSLELAQANQAMVLAFGSLSYLGEAKKALEEKRQYDR